MAAKKRAGKKRAYQRRTPAVVVEQSGSFERVLGLPESALLDARMAEQERRISELEAQHADRRLLRLEGEWGPIKHALLVKDAAAAVAEPRRVLRVEVYQMIERAFADHPTQMADGQAIRRLRERLIEGLLGL